MEIVLTPEPKHLVRGGESDCPLRTAVLAVQGRPPFANGWAIAKAGDEFENILCESTTRGGVLDLSAAEPGSEGVRIQRQLRLTQYQARHHWDGVVGLAASDQRRRDLCCRHRLVRRCLVALIVPGLP